MRSNGLTRVDGEEQLASAFVSTLQFTPENCGHSENCINKHLQRNMLLSSAVSKGVSTISYAVYYRNLLPGSKNEPRVLHANGVNEHAENRKV